MRETINRYTGKKQMINKDRRQIVDRNIDDREAIDEGSIMDR